MLHRPRNNVVDLHPSEDGEVRFGEPIDEKQVCLLLMLAHAENSIFRWDLPKTQFVIRRFLYNRFLPPNDTGIRGCFGVIGSQGGTLEALTMVSTSQQWYSSEPYLEEYIVYVHPEHRKSGHAGKLIDWLIALAERMSMPLLTGVISRTRMDAKCRMYQRKLMPVGQFFLHMPKADPRWESERVLSSIIGSSAAA
jgi:GNAT superfamily N-acetyltransferase